MTEFHDYRNYQVMQIRNPGNDRPLSAMVWVGCRLG